MATNEEVQSLREENAQIKAAIDSKTQAMRAKALDDENDRTLVALKVDNVNLKRELQILTDAEEASSGDVIVPDLITPVLTGTVDPSAPPPVTTPVVEGNETVEAVVQDDPWAQPVVSADEKNGQ